MVLDSNIVLIDKLSYLLELLLTLLVELSFNSRFLLMTKPH